ncbi:MAG: Ig-like domain-containing protein [Spirochaetales bacterium]|nr:Ig-like domain-containing protein [Spirochaetales bacterium]MCF7937453.1 Ig-like domain-containing protein [Spirochaetales bacterium]
MSPPQIVSHEPVSGCIGSKQVEMIRIRFSRPMRMSSVENALELFGDSGPRSAHFSWDNSELTVTPTPPIPPGEDILLSIGTSAEDSYGNSLEQGWELSFSTSPADQAFNLDTVRPEEGVVLTEREPIELVFNHPVREKSIAGNVNFSPSVGGVFEFTPRGSLMFLPDSPWKSYGGDIELEILEGLSSSSFNSLAERVSIAYKTIAAQNPVIRRVEAVNPGIPLQSTENDTITTQGIDIKSTFLIEFEDAISLDDSRDFVYIEPSAPVILSKPSPSVLSVCPVDPLEYNQRYELLVHAQRFPFLTNADSSRPPEILAVGFTPRAGIDPPELLSLNQRVEFETEHTAAFDIYGSSFGGNTLIPAEIAEAFSLYSPGGRCYFKIRTFVTSPSDCADLPDSQNFTVQRFFVDIIDPEIYGIMEILIGSNISDNSGNRMKDDFYREIQWTLP